MVNTPHNSTRDAIYLLEHNAVQRISTNLVWCVCITEVCYLLVICICFPTLIRREQANKQSMLTIGYVRGLCRTSVQKPGCSSSLSTKQWFQWQSERWQTLCSPSHVRRSLDSTRYAAATCCLVKCALTPVESDVRRPSPLAALLMRNKYTP